MSEERAEMARKAIEFEKRLVEFSLRDKAEMICIGRGVTNDANNADIAALFSGSDHHEREARVDFWHWLSFRKLHSRWVSLFGSVYSMKEMVEAVARRRKA